MGVEGTEIEYCTVVDALLYCIFLPMLVLLKSPLGKALEARWGKGMLETRVRLEREAREKEEARKSRYVCTGRSIQGSPRFFSTISNRPGGIEASRAAVIYLNIPLEGGRYVLQLGFGNYYTLCHQTYNP